MSRPNAHPTAAAHRRNSPTKNVGVAALALVLLAACAKNEAPQASGASGTNAGSDTTNVTCLSIRGINGWRPVDDRTLIIETRTEGRFQAEMFIDCRGLGRAEDIAIDGTDGKLCGDGSGHIRILDSNSAERACRVDRLIKLAN